MKHFHAHLSACLVAVALMMISCGSKESVESETKWGVFRSTQHLRSVTLLNLKPKSKLCVSGFQANEAIWAIQQWTNAIGRTEHLQVANCFNEPGTKSIAITGPQNSECQAGVAGHTDTVSRIAICENYTGNMLKHVLLHETGHMWGLCDQYDNGKDCQGGRVNPNTIMGAISGIPNLTEDDKQGILAITQSDAIPTNLEWKKLPSEQTPAGQSSPLPQGAAGQPSPQVLQGAAGQPQGAQGLGTNPPATPRSPPLGTNSPNACIVQVNGIKICR